MSKWLIKPPFTPYYQEEPRSLGLLSPAHGQRSQQQSGQITLQSVLTNKPECLKAVGHHAEIRKFEIPESMVVEAVTW